MESSTQYLEKWIFTRNSACLYYSSTPFKIGIHLRTYTVIFKYTRTNLLIGTKIYAVHIACIKTDLSLMNVFHLSINDWKTWHPTKYDIFFLFALFNHLLAAIEMTSRTFSFIIIQGIADEDFIFAAITIIVCFPNK